MKRVSYAGVGCACRFSEVRRHEQHLQTVGDRRRDRRARRHDSDFHDALKQRRPASINTTERRGAHDLTGLRLSALKRVAGNGCSLPENDIQDRYSFGPSRGGFGVEDLRLRHRETIAIVCHEGVGSSFDPLGADHHDRDSVDARMACRRDRRVLPVEYEQPLPRPRRKLAA